VKIRPTGRLQLDEDHSQRATGAQKVSHPDGDLPREVAPGASIACKVYTDPPVPDDATLPRSHAGRRRSWCAAGVPNPAILDGLRLYRIAMNKFMSTALNLFEELSNHSAIGPPSARVSS
jgi:hypothetical protein